MRAGCICRADTEVCLITSPFLCTQHRWRRIRTHQQDGGFCFLPNQSTEESQSPILVIQTENRLIFFFLPDSSKCLCITYSEILSGEMLGAVNTHVEDNAQ